MLCIFKLCYTRDKTFFLFLGLHKKYISMIHIWIFLSQDNEKWTETGLKEETSLLPMSLF